MPVFDLLAFDAAIMKELGDREVLRSANNPVGDLAENMFCRAFGWKQAPASEKGFDATDNSGNRDQIKGCRNKSRQLSAIVKSQSRFQERANSWIFTAKNKIWELSGVTDITAQLQEKEAELS